MSYFTNEEVVLYRKKYSNYEIGIKQIMEEKNIKSRTTVRCMLKGIRYKSLSGACKENRRSGRYPKFDQNYTTKIKQMKEEGFQNKQIAIKLGCSERTVGNRLK